MNDADDEYGGQVYLQKQFFVSAESTQYKDSTPSWRWSSVILAKDGKDCLAKAGRFLQSKGKKPDDYFIMLITPL